MRFYINNFKKLVFSGTAKDATVLLLGNVSSSFLAIVFTIIAARALGPESWGIVAAVGSLATILVAFGELGLDAGLLKFVSRLWKENKIKEAQKIFQVIFTVRIILATTITFILLTAAPLFAKFAFNSDQTFLVYFAALGFLTSLIVDYQIASTQAKQQWVIAAILITSTNIIRIIGILALYITENINLFSVLYIFTGAGLVNYMVSLYWHQAPFGFTKNWKKILYDIVPFSGWMGVNKIVSVFNSRIDVILLLSLTSAHQTGVYAAANRLAMGAPIIIASFATVLAPRLASFNTKDEVKMYFKKTIGLTFIIVTGLIFGIVVAPIVIKLFGSEYQGAGPVLQLLFVSYIPFTFSVPAVNTLIYSFKRPQIITLLTILQAPLVVFLNITLIPKLDIYAPIIILGLSNTITMLTTYYFVWRYFNEQSRQIS